MARSVIIITQHNDEHACAVHYCLQERGVDAHIYIVSDVIGAGNFAVSYEDQTVRLSVGTFEGNLSDVRSTWNRRLMQTFRDPPFLHPADREHVVYGAHSMNRGLTTLLDDRFPVNPLHASTITSNKLNQIEIARKVGLSVPPTLISSSPCLVRDFVNREGRVCVKPYTGQSWLTAEGPITSATTIIDQITDLSDESIALIPNIYQRFIDKKFELRVVIFGDFVAATKIGVDSESAGYFDWRSDISYLERLSPFEMPNNLVRQLKCMMKAIGLRIGAFDLIVNKDGDFVFLEINEGGQWLWQDLYCPGTNILQAFSTYLGNANDQFTFDDIDLDCRLESSVVLDLIKNDDRYHGILGVDYLTLYGEVRTEEAMVIDVLP